MANIFSIADARAFPYQGQIPLASATDYPDALVTEAAERITADFATICGVSFVPATETDEVLDGSGDERLILPRTHITGVTALARHGYGEASWTALTAGELATVVWYQSGIVIWPRGCWPSGAGTVRATYGHGYAEPPPAIHRAALILAVNQLVGSNISDRATQATSEWGVYNLSIAGWRDQAFFGLPPVDAVLARYSERIPAVG